MSSLKSILVVLLCFVLAMSALAEKPVRSIPSAGKAVALTFDDGLIPEIHERMLDICKEEGAVVTFFPIGNWVRDRELMERAIREGHEVGNHTMTHATLPELSRDEIFEEINGFQLMMKTEYGVEPKIFRAPRLRYDERVMEVLKELGLPAINASVGTRDWAPEVTATDVLKAATEEPH